jgi:hypothetical protein
LFDGITLTPDQEAKARALLTGLEAEQIAQNAILFQAVTSTLSKRVSLQAQRDSALRALLTSDADRATFDERVAPPAAGRGGRSGGPPPGSLGDGRGGGRRGAGGGDGSPGGRGGGGGRGVPTLVIVDATFHRLFDGITLSTEQEATARDLITRTQQDLQAITLPPPPQHLVWRPVIGVVVMQAESESALAALLTNDADRATLQSRISVAAPLAIPPRS